MKTKEPFISDFGKQRLTQLDFPILGGKHKISKNILTIQSSSMQFSSCATYPVFRYIIFHFYCLLVPRPGLGSRLQFLRAIFLLPTLLIRMDKSEIGIVISIYVALFLVIVIIVVACWKAVDRLEEREKIETRERATTANKPLAALGPKRVRFASTVQVC